MPALAFDTCKAVKALQGVCKLMMVSTLAIISTIIGGALALARYLAP